jgi:hypothetical protein
MRPNAASPCPAPTNFANSTRRFYGRFLIDRGAAGDRDRGRKLLEQAVAAYRSMGMPRHVAMAEELLQRAAR